jgi:hypothetical protein
LGHEDRLLLSGLDPKGADVPAQKV